MTITYPQSYDDIVEIVISDTRSSDLENSLREVMSSNLNPGVRQSIASHPKTPVTLLVELSRDEVAAVRRRVVDNLRTPPDVLVTLASDEDTRVKYAAFRNPNLPVETMESLVSSHPGDGRDVTDLIFLALNPSLPEHLAEELFDMGFAEVEDSLADNTGLSENMQLKLVKLKHEDVLYRLAQNVNSTVRVLEEINKFNFFKVKHALAVTENPNIPASVHSSILDLRKDHSTVSYSNLCYDVAFRTTHLEVMNKVIEEHAAPHFLAGLASNKNSPEEILNCLVLHVMEAFDGPVDKSKVFEAVLDNPNVTVTIVTNILGATKTREVHAFAVEVIQNFEPYDTYPVEWLEAAFPFNSGNV